MCLLLTFSVFEIILRLTKYYTSQGFPKASTMAWQCPEGHSVLEILAVPCGSQTLDLWLQSLPFLPPVWRPRWAKTSQNTKPTPPHPQRKEAIRAGKTDSSGHKTELNSPFRRPWMKNEASFQLYSALKKTYFLEGARLPVPCPLL